ncbi:hypothetical protein [Micromonospora zhanjiangensis]|uniref:Uncharacterized protein n=1 Tax=Micromonospora zhanjiangensis TaxID=1522057 RepID=A0ABV8KK53_9ACTN
MRFPAPGDLIYLDRSASVQFVNPFWLRLIRVRRDWITYDGWVWLDGYELDGDGEAVQRRSVFVQTSGLRIGKPGARTARRPP